MIASFISAPPDIQALITIGVTFVVSFLILQLLNVPALKWLGEYLGQYKTQIITWAVGLIVSLIDGLLLQIPLEFEPVALAAFQLIVAVAAAFGVFNYLANRGVNGLK